MKRTLGIAHFGLLYDISNQNGQVGRVELRDILALARSFFVFARVAVIASRDYSC